MLVRFFKATTLALVLGVLSLGVANAGKVEWNLLSRDFGANGKAGKLSEFALGVLDIGPFMFGFSLMQGNFGVKRTIGQVFGDLFINVFDDSHFKKTLENAKVAEPAMFGSYMGTIAYSFGSGNRGLNIKYGVGRGIYTKLQNNSNAVGGKEYKFHVGAAYQLGIGYDFRIFGPLGVEPYAKIYGLVGNDVLKSVGVNAVLVW